jgi:nucleotidyltransferase substrate binding protein (TIGR01987 family)
VADVEVRVGAAARAFATLQEVPGLKLAPVVARDLSILRFTYTFEAMWKATQAILAKRYGAKAGSPKGVLRAAREAGLLSDDDCAAALKMADDRNLVTHVYNETLAAELATRIDMHREVLARWLAALQREPSR